MSGLLVEAIQRHRDYLHTSGEIQRRDRARIAAELDATLRETLISRLLADTSAADLADLIEQIARRETTPQTIANLLTTGSSTARQSPIAAGQQSPIVTAHSEEKSSS